MVALRRKKGNIFIALITFILVLAGMFLILCVDVIYAGTEIGLPMMNIIFNLDGPFLTDTFKFNWEVLKDIKDINYLWAAVFCAPLVFSFLAIFLKRYRIFNILSFISLCLVIFVLFFGGVYLSQDINSIDASVYDFFNLNLGLDKFTMPFMIGRFALAGAGVFSFFNLMLCR